jgi:hypothetical protein
MTNTQIYITNNTHIPSVVTCNTDNIDNIDNIDNQIVFHFKPTLLSHRDDYVDDIINTMKKNGFTMKLRHISYNSQFHIEFHNKNKYICHYCNITYSNMIYNIMKHKNNIDLIIIDKELESHFDDEVINNLKQYCNLYII